MKNKNVAVVPFIIEALGIFSGVTSKREKLLQKTILKIGLIKSVRILTIWTETFCHLIPSESDYNNRFTSLLS